MKSLRIITLIVIISMAFLTFSVSASAPVLSKDIDGKVSVQSIQVPSISEQGEFVKSPTIVKNSGMQINSRTINNVNSVSTEIAGISKSEVNTLAKDGLNDTSLDPQLDNNEDFSSLAKDKASHTPLPGEVETKFTATPLSGTTPLTTYFTDQSEGLPNYWIWFFGDLTTSFTQDPAKIYRKPGNYRVALYAKNLTNGSKDSLVRENYIQVTGITPPSQLHWKQMTSSSGIGARAGQNTVAIPNGHIIVMGGSCDGRDMNDTWRSTDKGATWSRLTANAEWSARGTPATGVLSDGSIILSGGYDNIKGILKNDTWRSTDEGSTWQLMNDNPGWLPRSSHSMAVLPNDDIVIMGGSSMTGTYNDTWRSTDKGATWTQMTAAAPWDQRRGQRNVVLSDGSIILMGGQHLIYSPIKRLDSLGDVWKSTDEGATWTLITNNPGWQKRAHFGCVALSDDRIFVFGGSDKPYTYYNDVWCSSDKGATWTELNPFSEWGARDYFGTGIVLPDNSIVFLCGDAADIDGTVSEAGVVNLVETIYSDCWLVNLAPVISSITPSTGENNRPISITNLSGSGFVSPATVKLTRNGQKNIPATNVKVVSPTKITCTFPINGKTAGKWNIMLTTGGQTVTKKNLFIITAASTKPVITTITPKSEYNSVNTDATITGKNFDLKATVKLRKGSISKSAAIKKISSTQITCTLPLTKLNAGEYSITIRNPDGKTATKSKAFKVIAAGKKPTITAISPKSGFSSKNTGITITGTNFRPKAIVQMIKGPTKKKASIKSLGTKKIVCTFLTKGVTAGKWSVKITNTDKTTVNKKDIFTVKTSKSANQTESGFVSSVVLNNPVSMTSSATPSRGNILSGGLVVPASVPVMSQGVPVI